MNPFFSRTYRSRGRQGGAVLVTSMLLLLVLTVLGVAMMRMTNMQERMAGNTRDLNLALQAAEAGLRDGENRVFNLPGRPVTSGLVGCLICQTGTLPVAIYDKDVFNWGVNAQKFGDSSTKEFTDLFADPRYTLEEVGFEPPDLGFGTYEGRVFYQVTSRSTGASGQANTVLQSTYARYE